MALSRICLILYPGSIAIVLQNTNLATPDNSPRPAHYAPGEHDLIAFWLNNGMVDAIRGNIMKYVLRAGRKGPALGDLYKAREYLNRWIEYLENQ
jgi:hypothetical protein